MYRGESNEQGENKQKETVKREDKKGKGDSDERGGTKGNVL